MDFGIIGEGPTDQIVIENILRGFCNDKNLDPTWLQPLPDGEGNWDKVFQYIKSEVFRQSFGQVDFVVIQVDSDVFGGTDVDEDHKLELSQKTVEQSVELIRELLIRDMGSEFYAAASSRIIFAIAINEIECWLLPVFFPNQKKKAQKTTGCISTLNEVMFDTHGFYIDAKDLDYYRTMSKPFRKKKDLTQFGKLNPSFDLFLSELEAKTSSGSAVEA